MLWVNAIVLLIDAYVSDNYVQHSPSLKAGKAGLLEAIEYLKQLQEPKEKKSPIVSAIEDGDFVMVQLDLVFMERQKSVIDIFRLQDGKVVEHWDAIQDQPEKNEEVIHQGIMLIEDFELTEKNKVLVSQFYHSIAQNSAIGNGYLSSEYIEHNPDVIKTMGRLDTFLSDPSKRLTTKVHRILGEGNLVAVQSEGKRLDGSFVFYDLLKVTNNQIVEHWSVEQEIPKVMPHANGMI